MELIEIIGYIGALAIGVSLGLIGGGGSILAVPVLAYLFSVNEKVATAYSLFIVGTSSLVGGIKQHLKGYVDWRTAIVFGLPLGITWFLFYQTFSLQQLVLNLHEEWQCLGCLQS